MYFYYTTFHFHRQSVEMKRQSIAFGVVHLWTIKTPSFWHLTFIVPSMTHV